MGQILLFKRILDFARDQDAGMRQLFSKEIQKLYYKGKESERKLKGKRNWHRVSNKNELVELFRPDDLNKKEGRKRNNMATQYYLNSLKNFAWKKNVFHFLEDTTLHIPEEERRVMKAKKINRNGNLFEFLLLFVWTYDSNCTSQKTDRNRPDSDHRADNSRAGDINTKAESPSTRAEKEQNSKEAEEFYKEVTRVAPNNARKRPRYDRVIRKGKYFKNRVHLNSAKKISRPNNLAKNNNKGRESKSKANMR